MTLFEGDRSGGGRRWPWNQDHHSSRLRMVEDQIRRRGVTDPLVLEAIAAVPRHLFVPADQQSASYGDHALPIGFGQTISQPFIVALMTAALEPQPGLRVLEVGTGSGYQAAVLGACGMEVYSVERIPELFEVARVNLETSGCGLHVRLRLADGSRGWADEAPFERILITAAAASVPHAIAGQLAVGGVLVAPVGDPYLQTIYRYRKRADGSLEAEALEGARFVPLITEEDDDGEAAPADTDDA